MFIDTRFPEDISFDAVASTQFSTNIADLNNGFEQRNVNWKNARREYKVSSGMICEASKDALLSLFNNAKGRAHSFRYKDWSDYKAENQPIGVGDGTEVDFQLIKTYQIAGESCDRLIIRPVLGSVNIYINATLASPGTDYGIDYSTGVVSFVTAPANLDIITADFEFDIDVRFNSDSLDIIQTAENAYKVEKLSLIEVK